MHEETGLAGARASDSQPGRFTAPLLTLELLSPLLIDSRLSPDEQRRPTARRSALSTPPHTHTPDSAGLAPPPLQGPINSSHQYTSFTP